MKRPADHEVHSINHCHNLNTHQTDWGLGSIFFTLCRNYFAYILPLRNYWPSSEDRLLKNMGLCDSHSCPYKVLKSRCLREAKNSNHREYGRISSTPPGIDPVDLTRTKPL
uniref:Uncharacterized protein n=1 Tax=Cacopsylla melanoneura TaxID=428564 RepID=A0A8D8ZNL8_9HEMI